MVQRCENEPAFLRKFLFTDEAQFNRDGFFNCRNCHIWARHNPRVIFQRHYQQRFAVNVWAGILDDHVIGPYLLPPRLNGVRYRVFIEQVLPELLEDVPLHTHHQMWMQLDVAPAHFSAQVRRVLSVTYPGRWIGRGGPVAWPPRSPDLTPLDFFLWGHIKSLVYETPVPDEETLLARILVASDEVREMPDVSGRVRQSFLHRCNACIECGGRHFEHIL